MQPIISHLFTQTLLQIQLTAIENVCIGVSRLLCISRTHLLETKKTSRHLIPHFYFYANNIIKIAYKILKVMFHFAFCMKSKYKHTSKYIPKNILINLLMLDVILRANLKLSANNTGLQ